MTTSQDLKELALWLEHESVDPAALCIMIGGETVRLTDPRALPYLEKISDKLCQLERAKSEQWATREMPALRCCEFEDY